MQSLTYLEYANLVGWAGSVLMVGAFWTRSDRLLNLVLAAGLAVMGVHLAMLGAMTATVCCAISALRCLLALLLGPSRTLAVLACLGTLATALPTWGGLASGLTIAAMLLTNIILATQTGVRLRILMLPVSAVWLASFVVENSWPGMLTECLVALGNIFGIMRLRHVMNAPQVSVTQASHSVMTAD